MMSFMASYPPPTFWWFPPSCCFCASPHILGLCYFLGSQPNCVIIIGFALLRATMKKNKEKY
jgi:hypothetical protein